jgi:hypothetical protein
MKKNHRLRISAKVGDVKAGNAACEEVMKKGIAGLKADKVVGVLAANEALRERASAASQRAFAKAMKEAR